MRQFFKFVFASMLGFVVGFFLLMMILIGVASVLINSLDDEKVTEVKSSTFLLLDFKKPIVDRASKNPFENLSFASFGGEGSVGLNTLLDNLRKAKSDKNIKGIYMELSTVNTGMAASMGSVLLGAGTKGKRFALPHSRILMHQPSGGTQGQSADIDCRLSPTDPKWGCQAGIRYQGTTASIRSKLHYRFRGWQPQ